VREDVSVESLAGLLLDQGLHGVPVVDAAGRLIGFVSTLDLVRHQHDDGDATPEAERAADLDEVMSDGFHVEPLARATVRDVMTPTALALCETAPIVQAAALMAFEGVHQIPIVSELGVVVGLLTALDVMRWVAEGHGYLVAAPGHGEDHAKAMPHTLRH
jgi:CBS domain-containing protein